MSDEERQVERRLDELAAKARPEQLHKLDGQLAAKLERLEREGKAPGQMVERLRILWRMLEADEQLVPWKAKALIMAAVSYFASPLDAIPDGLPGGYLDDALVVKIVHRRLQKEIEAFTAAGTRA